MKISNIIPFAIAAANGALAQEITGEVYSKGNFLNFGSLTVDSNAFWSIYDSVTDTFFGDFTNKGGFYITVNGALGLNVKMAAAYDFINEGTISFQSVESYIGPSILLSTLNFYNDGEIFFNTQQAALGAAYGITNSVVGTWNNTRNGKLYLYSNANTQSVLFLGSGIVPSPQTIHNDGQICLTGQIWQQETLVKGSGCVNIGHYATLSIANSLLSFDSEQTIYLSDSTSQLIVDDLSLGQTFTVAGFGNGNVIGLTVPIFTKTYDVDSGILTLNNQKFLIGKGYDISQLTTVTTGGFGSPILPIISGGVKWTAAPPAGATSSIKCSPCVSPPAAPPLPSGFTSS